MVALGVLYLRVSSLPAVISAFSGLHVLVVAIVAIATLSFGRTSLKKRSGFVIAALAASAFLLNLHPVVVIGSSAVVGMLLLTNHNAAQVIAPVAKRGSPPRLNLLYNNEIDEYLLG